MEKTDQERNIDLSKIFIQFNSKHYICPQRAI